MQKTTPIIMVRTLDIKRGGVTKATIKRANMLAETYSEVIIATFYYQQFYKKIINTLYDKKMLSKKVKVMNFFEDIKSHNKKTIKRKKRNNLQSVKVPGLTEVIAGRKRNELSYRYYKDGLYIMYKRFNEEGYLKFIEHRDVSGNRTKREEYDELGNIMRVRHMNRANKPHLDRYIDYDGKCYLTVHKGSTKSVEGITIQFGTTTKEYKSLQDYKIAWFNDILSTISHPVVTCELRGLEPILLQSKHNNIKRVSVVHNSHLGESSYDINNIAPAYKNLFATTDKRDNIVFLTNGQKEDVEKVYGTHENFIVIPHSCEKGNYKGKRKRSTQEVHPKLAITLARFHENKRLDEAIKAFKMVIEKVPDAKYYIFGYGSLKRELQTLIKALNLENNIKLKDYTMNPEETYKSAACSILTSEREGFGMVITESMAAGTPVISYDTKYGPSDIINDGIDGYIVEKGNRKQLAEKIIKVLTNNDLQQKLSENAKNITSKYSEEKYKKLWQDLYS